MIADSFNDMPEPKPTREMIKCSACGGTGSFQGKMSMYWPQCPECNGRGSREKTDDDRLLEQFEHDFADQETK